MLSVALTAVARHRPGTAAGVALLRAAPLGPASQGALVGGAAPRSAPGASRGFYFPRNNWLPWRQRLVHQRQEQLRKNRHIWPRQPNPDEAPIFGDKYDGTHVAFREKDLRIGLKRLNDYCKMCRGRQLQDAIDWLDSMARMNTEPITKLLRRTMQECSEKRDMDPARLFILEALPQRGRYVKELKKHARANFGLVRRPRNSMLVKVRQLPLEEFFHRLYIRNKVPRSLAADMRLALEQSRVSPQMQKEWSPYLYANSRFFHRKELKWLDRSRQFDYYEARREWIARYKANQLRASAEAREARGLAPLPSIAS